MKNKFIYLFMGALLLASCMKNEFDTSLQKEQIEENVKNVFGVSFDPNHDWCTASNGSITIENVPIATDKVQLLAFVAESDTTTSMFTLNESYVNGENTITLNYDIPKDNKGMFVCVATSNGKFLKMINGNVIDLSDIQLANVANKRANRAENTSLVISSAIESYANIRGWIPNELLYGMGDEDYLREKIIVSDYDNDYKALFRAIIFSHFKNGKQYNNSNLINESGLYNENAYLVTTTQEPIVISPVYKSDKAKQYGNEIYNSDLYYYYYKQDALTEFVNNGGNEIDFLTNLPKYKAIQFNQHFDETEDDIIAKKASYQLVYWGDENPTIGTQGTYYFPSGYKIGFMVRAKTTAEDGKKQGELYGDGRLNTHINNYHKTNFKNSKLENVGGARMTLISLNGIMYACFESGTDSDFNDIIFEIEGGVKKMEFVPEFDNNTYTFCFEDREIGDYDLNDIVIKASRINKTNVEYRIVACGANDKLYILNVNGSVINKNTEVHSLFGMQPNHFINTVKNDEKFEPVTEVITVDENFSFLDENTQPCILNASTNRVILLSKKGQDPHGIMIPYDFKHPLEQVCVKNAYQRFNDWGINRITSTDWYKYYNENLVW